VKAFLHGLGNSNDAANLSKFARHHTCLVKLDPFHLLQRNGRCLNSKADPMFGVFTSMMRDALFVTNKDDEKQLKAYLSAARQAPAEQVDKISRPYFTKHCRRSIPPPAILAARLQRVYDLFKDAKLANGRPLYNTKKGG